MLPYVCPEPVLENVRVAVEDGAKKAFSAPNSLSMLDVGSNHHVPSVVTLPGAASAAPPGIASSKLRHHITGEQNHTHCSVFFLLVCLTTACIGKPSSSIEIFDREKASFLFGSSDSPKPSLTQTAPLYAKLPLPNFGKKEDSRFAKRTQTSKY